MRLELSFPPEVLLLLKFISLYTLFLIFEVALRFFSAVYTMLKMREATDALRKIGDSSFPQDKV